MTSKNMTFDTIYSFKWFTVEYELFADGRTLIMDITYDNLPIDVPELATNKDHRLLYKHITQAINNNARSIREVKPFDLRLKEKLLSLL